MLNLFKIKFGKSMIVSFTIQQVLVAASSWVLVNFIHQTAALKNFQISNIIVLILVAISPYIPGFIANYFYNLWVVFARTDNTHRFIKLIDGQKNWVFDSKKRDEVFALQRENASLIDETSRFFYLNFPVILNLIFNSVAIGFLLGTDITLGMLGGLAVSSLQFFLIPRFTQKIQKEKQETQYESEKRFLGFWQVVTLQNQPFHKNANREISDCLQKTEGLSFQIYKFEAFTNTLVLFLSFLPITAILLFKFNDNQLDQVFLMSLGVLFPRILQIFNMSSNLIIAGQSLQALRIKWISFQERFLALKDLESHVMNASTKHISIIETNTNTEVSLETALNEKKHGRFLLKGPNGSGKSTLCLKLKAEYENVFYLPAKFENPALNLKGSTGEVKLAELSWLHKHRADYSMIILDEWDANLDAHATTKGDSLIQEIAQNCLVFEVRHKEARIKLLS